MSTNAAVLPFSLFTDFDIDLFKSGKHYRLYEKLGSHVTTVEGETGVYFAVWAPSAAAVRPRSLTRPTGPRIQLCLRA